MTPTPPQPLWRKVLEANGWKQRVHGGWSRDGDLLNVSKDLPPLTLDALREMEEKCINADNEFAYQCALSELSGHPYGYRASKEQRLSALARTLGIKEGA